MAAEEGEIGVSEEIAVNNEVMIEETSKRAGLSKPVKRFVRDVVLGMIKPPSVRLSENEEHWWENSTWKSPTPFL